MLLTDNANPAERSIIPHSDNYKGLRVESNFIRLVQSRKENIYGFFTLYR
jgi:hypothetical protein